jgi:hypothetical protein
LSKLTTRRALILVLVAGCCLLVVPSVAGAHVRSKHRAEYRAKMSGLNKTFSVYAQAYDNAKAASQYWADTIAATTDHDLQLQYEAQALIVYTANLGLPAQWNLSYAKAVSSFRNKATRYFARAADQNRFKTRCNRLKAYAGMLILLGNVHVYDSFQDLSSDPPDYITAQAMRDAGDEDAAAGHEGFDKQLAALKALL